jgi:hypothetical protein
MKYNFKIIISIIILVLLSTKKWKGKVQGSGFKGSEVKDSGSRVQGSAQPLAAEVAGLIENETSNLRSLLQEK